MDRASTRLLAAGLLLVVTAAGGPARAAEGTAPPAQDWSFVGLWGVFDGAARQRGFQVFKEVCAGCHGIGLIAYRNLEALGFGEEEIKAIAAEYSVIDGPNDEGEMFERPAKASDRWVPPFANENAARATNNGALPPDLSLITKARKGGADYLFAVLTGYDEAACEGELMAGMHCNRYFPGKQIAMPPPLLAGGVEFADGTEASVEQMARDVTEFLAWAAEPELEARKRMGIKVMIFLIIFTAFLYAVKRKVWADIH